MARSAREARAAIVARGAWPCFVSFDHDLGPGGETGHDLAKWMAERALDGEPVFPA